MCATCPSRRSAYAPENGFEPKYITIRGRGEILTRIRKEARSRRQDLSRNRPGPRRRGHFLASGQRSGHRPEHSACRIEFNEVTCQGRQGRGEKPRGPSTWTWSTPSRRAACWTAWWVTRSAPFCGSKVKKGLSAGRVQSVAAKMICDRENEIEIFVPEEYWTIAGELQRRRTPAERRASTAWTAKRWTCTPAKSATRVHRPARARERHMCASRIKQSERRKYPAAPFTTSNLQQEASRKLNFTTQKTMQIAQQLYEGVDIGGRGLAGSGDLYPYRLHPHLRRGARRRARNDSRPPTASDYLPAEPNVYKSRKSAQDAHEAIRPTDISAPPRRHQGFPDAGISSGCTSSSTTALSPAR